MVSSVAEQRRSLCESILGYYMSAVDELPESLIPLVREAGFCFGFLDPVSNIMANTVLYKASLGVRKANQEEQGRREKRRKRSQPGTSSEGGSSKVICTSDFSSIADRSLQGLVTFLTSYFRYLHAREALHYLSMSNADLFVAVYLIEKHRRASCTSSAIHCTIKIALSCAALSAKHSQPNAFVSSSLILVSRLEVVYTLLQTDPMKLSMLSAGVGADLREPVLNAAKRFCGPVRVSPPVGIDHELSMKRLLLDKIHGFYLEAISRLPKTLLRSRLHRALLKAGHCYGPFDPVSNIILNTIWYDTTFPHHELKVDVVLMESLALVESRSLHGLVASMFSIFPTFSMNDILRRLLKYGSVSGVVKKVGEKLKAPISVSRSAYHAAATRACHPYPDALARFVAGLPQEVEMIVMPLLEAKNTLSVDDVKAISKSVVGYTHVGSVNQLEWSKRDSQSISDSCKEFEARQRFICQRVEAALQEHARRWGDDYELHSICGVNVEIPHDGKFGYFLNRNGYPFSHINAWVTRRDTHHTDAVPTLLFIECSNNCKDMKGAPLMCCVVSGSSEDAGRCFHCERSGTKIVHPYLGSYHGQEKDFEDMACGKHPLTNEELIGYGKMRTVFADTVETEPLMYLPESRHSSCNEVY
ncbi:unnamed protein product [Urochloa decumbens]|uniref:Uncharacterized protein n=1 Tax=Urochloa decumbens TaxID=240449 RepID=A0ABC8X747_9POAL